MIDIMVDLQGEPKLPLYEKIYEYIKKDIIDGRISQGEKLPSTRLLAANLSVSRSTVELAYDQLLAEGYIRSEPCRGFFACDITELYRLKEGKRPLPVPAEQPPETDRDWIDFSPYAIDAGSFPFSVWRRLSKNVLMDDREELLYAGNGQGEESLRNAIAGYLHQARGVNCSASDLIIGAGSEYLEILLAQLLGRNQRVLMDDPGYPQAYRTFSNMGYQIVTAPATCQEISREQLLDLDPDVIYLMPSHQFPLGTVMPLKQRLLLLEWAAGREGHYLIEDDHDSEYRYRGKPIPSMQSIDHCGKVIYIGTFSKSIAPSLRISYMVLPPALMEQYHRICGFYATTVPKMQQEILCSFIREGHFERHLNKMRGIYRGKRDFLLAELKKYDWVGQISGDYAGLYVLVQLRTSAGERKLCGAAADAGIRIFGISQYRFAQTTEEEGEPVILLGYGKLSGEEMRQGLQRLDEIIRNC